MAGDVLLGGALGFVGGLFGIGGGIIVIPLLVLAFGMDQAVAQGTALVMIVPNLWYPRSDVRRYMRAGCPWLAS